MDIRNLSELEYLPGDIGTSTDESWMGKGIRFFGALQTGAAKASHVFCCLSRPLIIEAVAKIRINNISKYDNPCYTRVALYRFPLSEIERIRFWEGMSLKAAEGYGWHKLLFFALDSLCSKVGRLFGAKKPCFFFTSSAKIFNIPVCSQFAVYGLHKFTSYRLLDQDHKEVNWRNVSPDYFEDLIELPHNRVVRIYERKKEPKK